MIESVFSIIFPNFIYTYENSNNKKKKTPITSANTKINDIIMEKSVFIFPDFFGGSPYLLASLSPEDSIRYTITKTPKIGINVSPAFNPLLLIS